MLVNTCSYKVVWGPDDDWLSAVTAESQSSGPQTSYKGVYLCVCRSQKGRVRFRVS